MDANELTRLLLNLIRKGSVTEVDLALQQCRVKSGDLTTNFIPWMTLRAGTTRTWNPPTVGEQVVLFSPGGDIADAVALCGIYSDDAPAPSASAAEGATHYPDGAVIAYDHVAHALTATLPGGGSAVLTAPASVTVVSESITLDAPETTCTGNLTVQKKLTYQGGMAGSGDAGGGKAANIAGDVVISNKSFLDHVHQEQGAGQSTSAPL